MWEIGAQVCTLRCRRELTVRRKDPTYKVPETTKRDISTEALGGVFVDDGLGDHSIGYLGLDDAFKVGLHIHNHH